MRIRKIWIFRLFFGGFALVYLASDSLQLWLPPLLPFLAAAAVEAQFFVSGVRARGSSAAGIDRGPSERDLADFGWATRVESVGWGESELLLRPGEMADWEIAEWLELHREELEALGPGLHRLAPISAPDSPVAPYVEPVATPRPRLGRRVVQSALVLAVLAGVFLLDQSRPGWQKLSPRTRSATVSLLAREASRIAGHRAEVICDVSGEHVGYVQDADGLAEVGGRRLWLTPQICYRLYLTRHRPGRLADTASGQAIAVLAHEAWHLQGQRSEAVANCYAYQSGVHVGTALGLSDQTARRLMHEQLVDNPAEFADTPAYVVTAACTRGGSLDLHLDGTHFP
jgi:hypothetical protein